jgi:hypothetical protein
MKRRPTVACAAAIWTLSALLLHALARPASALAHGPRTIDEFLAVCRDCEKAEPTAAMTAALNEFESRLAGRVANGSGVRYCFDRVIRQGGAIMHHQRYCDAVYECARVSVSHMADQNMPILFQFNGSLIESCPREQVAPMRRAFLEAFVNCRTPELTRAAVDQLDANSFDPGANAATDVESAMRSVKAMEAASIPKDCGRMFGLRQVVRGPAPNESVTVSFIQNQQRK